MTQQKTVGMYESFIRSGRPTRATHYCAGCGHGIIHKLIAEAMVELGLQDRTIIVNPIGCGVFGYYYWDCGNVGAAHGRAPSVGTAINRVRREAVVVSYQGDGDLAAIGFNNTFQAASRGEHMAVFFVNNAVYGMTGGQMAPTTLEGTKTTTSPFGRNPVTSGHPLHVCEVLQQLKAPVYIERVSVADTRRIMQARRAVRKALEIQRDGKGYAFVEFISPCPTNMGVDSVKAALYCMEELEKEFPLGCLRDASATAVPRAPLPPAPSVEAFFTQSEQQRQAPAEEVDATFKEQRLKFAGFGGQGILSLGVCVAEAARLEKRFTTWFPSYGPEQRGGSAACSVVISGQPIGSPAVDYPDVLVCMNQPSYERFVGDVKPGGTVIVDATVPLKVKKEGVRVVSMPAIDLSLNFGVPQAANTLMLGALARLNVTGLTSGHLLDALEASFMKKPALVEKNRLLFGEAVAWMEKNGF